MHYVKSLKNVNLMKIKGHKSEENKECIRTGNRGQINY